MRVLSSILDSLGGEKLENRTKIFLDQFKASTQPDSNLSSSTMGEDILGDRFLARSISPHLQKLLAQFNRNNDKTQEEMNRYWKEAKNKENLRLAYFLGIAPANSVRFASILGELSRLGYQFPFQTLDAIDWGAGPGSVEVGLSWAIEHLNSMGFEFPSTGKIALIEQDKGILELGQKWIEHNLKELNCNWEVRPFHRHLTELSLPPRAPVFNFWTSSFFLNELIFSPEELSDQLVKLWDKHLAENGLIILMEPALKNESRKLLELRKHILSTGKYQILTPCLGNQVCGALESPEDWCHEEVLWQRPPYFKKLDQILEIDRKHLAFSYLVLVKSRMPQKALQKLANIPSSQRFRLVSPPFKQGNDLEFFSCHENGKFRGRLSPKHMKVSPQAFTDNEDFQLTRGDILQSENAQGSPEAFRFRLARVLE